MTDGHGTQCQARIADIHGGSCARLVLEERISVPEVGERVQLRVCQAIPRHSKMDFLIEKAQELGVDEVCPIETERSVVKVKGADREKKLIRWQKIVVEAVKQSGSLRALRIDLPCSFRDAVNVVEAHHRVALFHPGEESLAFNAWARNLEQPGEPQPHLSVILFLGPEGGFSENEVAWAEANFKERKIAYNRVGLGQAILKSDTAFLAAISAIRLMIL